MVDMTEILRLIDERMSELKKQNPKVSDTWVSRRATDSSDTIRNWRRAVRDNKQTTPNMAKLQAIGEVLGIDLTVGEIPPKVETEAGIEELLRRIADLNPNDIEFLMKAIKTARAANLAAREQTPSRGQP